MISYHFYAYEFINSWIFCLSSLSINLNIKFRLRLLEQETGHSKSWCSALCKRNGWSHYLARTTFFLNDRAKSLRKMMAIQISQKIFEDKDFIKVIPLFKMTVTEMTVTKMTVVQNDRYQNDPYPKWPLPKWLFFQKIYFTDETYITFTRTNDGRLGKCFLFFLICWQIDILGTFTPPCVCPEPEIGPKICSCEHTTMKLQFQKVKDPSKIGFEMTIFQIGHAPKCQKMGTKMSENGYENVRKRVRKCHKTGTKIDIL